METVHVQTHTHARTSTKHRLCRHHEVDCGHGSKIFTSIRYEIDVRRGRASIGDRPRCNRRCEFNELVAWACVSVCLSESHVNVQPVVIYMFSIRVYHCVCIYICIYIIYKFIHFYMCMSKYIKVMCCMYIYIYQFRLFLRM